MSQHVSLSARLSRGSIRIVTPRGIAKIRIQLGWLAVTSFTAVRLSLLVVSATMLCEFCDGWQGHFRDLAIRDVDDKNALFKNIVGDRTPGSADNCDAIAFWR